MIQPVSALRPRLLAAPRPLVVAALLLALHATGLSVFGIYEFTQVQPGRVMTGVVSALLLVVWGLGLGAAGWALLGGRLWARGPVMAVQILHLPIAWSFRGGETTWVAVVLGLTSLAIIALVVHPASTRFLTGRETVTDPGPDDHR